MADDHSKKNKPDATNAPTHPFTVDEETRLGVNEMPSVTRLLNRKKLVIPGKIAQESKRPQAEPQLSEAPLSDDEPTTIAELPDTESLALPPEPSGGLKLSIDPPASGPAFPEPAQAGGDSIKLELPSEAPPFRGTAPAPKATPAVTAAVKPARAPAAKLEHWDLVSLKKNPDPLAKVVTQLVEKNSATLVFLSMQANPKNPGVPLFLATSFAGKDAKSSLWNGVRWDPTVTPPLWNYFVRTGFVELSPPDANTDQNSHRNVMRAAFGVPRGSWLTLLRVGSASSCRGMLAVITAQSLSNKNQELLTLLAK